MIDRFNFFRVFDSTVRPIFLRYIFLSGISTCNFLADLSSLLFSSFGLLFFAREKRMKRLIFSIMKQQNHAPLNKMVIDLQKLLNGL